VGFGSPGETTYKGVDQRKHRHVHKRRTERSYHRRGQAEADHVCNPFLQIVDFTIQSPTFRREGRTDISSDLLRYALIMTLKNPLEGVERVDDAHVSQREWATNDGNPGYGVRDEREIRDHQDALYSGDDLGYDIGVEC
jgi:hypothetical protein